MLLCIACPPSCRPLQSFERSEILDAAHLLEFRRLVEQFIEQEARKPRQLDWCVCVGVRL